MSTTIISILGILIVMTFVVFSIMNVQTYTNELNDRTQTLVDMEIYKLLDKAVKGSNFFVELLGEVQCENCENFKTEYCLRKKENVTENINILSTDRKFLKISSLYLRTFGLLYSRYAETSKNAISTGFDVDTGKSEFVSFNADGSLYNTDYHNNTDPDLANYSMIVPVGVYDVNRKEWYSRVSQTSKPSWTTYISAYTIKAISYSVPLFFGNGTLKGLINVCLESHLTKTVLTEIKDETGVDVLLLDGDNYIISTSFSGVNETKAVYSSRNGWSNEPLNITETGNAFLLSSFENYYLKNKGVLKQSSKYYIECLDVTSIEESETGWKMCVFIPRDIVETSTIYVVVIFMGITAVVIVFGLVLSVLIMNFILNKAIKPINAVLKKMEKYHQIDNISLPTIYPSEFDSVIQSIIKNYNHIHSLRNYLPEEAIISTINSIHIEPVEVPICVAYIDLVGFTEMTKDMVPKKIVHLLNKFSAQVFDFIDTKDKIIFDKLIGDCVMYYAMEEDYDSNACSTMTNWAIDLCEKLHPNSYKFSIGLDYGKCFRGCVGNPIKQITVIGKAANVASRVQSLCKDHYSKLLVTNNVFDGIDGYLQKKFGIVDENAEIRGIVNEKYRLYGYLSKEDRIQNK